MPKIATVKSKLIAAAVTLLLSAGAAQAALPTEATAAFDEMKGNVTEMGGLIWGVVLVSVALFATIKMFKRGMNKAV